MTKTNRISLAIVRSPLVWGSLASLGFYALIHTGLWREEFAKRYFAGHWVEYVETAMFFVGLAGLALKALDLVRQSSALGRPVLGPAAATTGPAGDSQELLGHLAALPGHRQNDYLPRRLREALQWIGRSGSADQLDEHLQYLSETDAGRSHASYALLRIIIWAIPILGFLGTVIGITLAVANLNPQALEDSLPTVTGGLGVAFDTTALALGLSMVLMFVQFFVDRMEGRLLAEVDSQAAAELDGRFTQFGAGGDPRVAAVRRMAETVLQASERLVERQAEVWQATIAAAHEHWSEAAAAGQKQLETALSVALAHSVKDHAERLAAAAESAAEKNRRHWDRLQKALAESTERTRSHEAELAKQGELLLRVVQAIGQVTALEEALNGNLAALAGAQHLEETLLNLAGAIHLLNARLGQVTSLGPQVELQARSGVGKAA